MGVSQSDIGCLQQDGRYWLGSIDSKQYRMFEPVQGCNSVLSAELWHQAVSWCPSSHVALASCDWSTRCGSLHWRAAQQRLVLLGLDGRMHANKGKMPWLGRQLCIVEMPKAFDFFRTLDMWKNSLRNWLLQWSSVKELAFTRGTSAEGILWALKHLAYDNQVMPALKTVSLCHAQDALVQDVALVWQLCQRRSWTLDWRATAAMTEVVDSASARGAGCNLEGCPAAHVTRRRGDITLVCPSVSELLDLRPACRRCLADELHHFQLPPTCGGCPAGSEAEALLLSYLIPTAPRRGRTAGHSTLPYILAVNNRGEQLEQAAALGAELSMQLPNGAHPLFGAAMFGRLQSLEVLLKHCQHTALDLANSRGTTPLMAAAMHGQEAALARLQQAGADTSLRNCDGHNAANLSATQKGNKKSQNRHVTSHRIGGAAVTNM